MFAASTITGKSGRSRDTMPATFSNAPPQSTAIQSESAKALATTGPTPRRVTSSCLHRVAFASFVGSLFDERISGGDLLFGLYFLLGRAQFAKAADGAVALESRVEQLIKLDPS